MSVEAPSIKTAAQTEQMTAHGDAVDTNATMLRWMLDGSDGDIYKAMGFTEEVSNGSVTYSSPTLDQANEYLEVLGLDDRSFVETATITSGNTVRDILGDGGSPYARSPNHRIHDAGVHAVKVMLTPKRAWGFIRTGDIDYETFTGVSGFFVRGSLHGDHQRLVSEYQKFMSPDKAKVCADEDYHEYLELKAKLRQHLNLPSEEQKTEAQRVGPARKLMKIIGIGSRTN